MCKIKKSIRLSDKHISYIMSISEDSKNFSECLELVLEKVMLQDEFLEVLAEKNHLVSLAKGYKKNMERAIQCQQKNNRLIRSCLENTEKVLFLHKSNKEVDQYYDKLEEII